MLLVALVALAQKSVTISPVLKVGMEKTYTIRGEATTPGSAAAEAVGELNYKVVDKTSDGFQINMKSSFTKFDTNQMLASLTSYNPVQILNMMNVEMLTGSQGQFVGIKNGKELVAQSHVMIDTIFHTVMSKNMAMKGNEEIKSTMQKTISLVKDMMDEKFLSESFGNMPSVTMLNGKTITDGMVEDGTFAQLFKTKTTYSLLNGGKTIVLNTKGDVDKQFMKEYLLKMLDRLLPESMIKETSPEQLVSMIENMIASGSMKVGMNQKVTYDVGDDGWVKKFVMEMDMDMPGQTVKSRQVQTLKE